MTGTFNAALNSAAWWAIWAVRVHEFTNFFQFLIMVLPRLLFVLVSFLLSPPIEPGRPFDLHAYYYRHIPWMAGLAAAAMIGIALSRSVFGVDEPVSAINGLRVAAAVVLVAMGFSKNERVHVGAVYALTALFVIAIVAIFLGRA